MAHRRHTRPYPIDVSFALPQDQFPKGFRRCCRRPAPCRSLARGSGRDDVLAKVGSSPSTTRSHATTGTVKPRRFSPMAAAGCSPNPFVNVSLAGDTLTAAVTVPVKAVRHCAG